MLLFAFPRTACAQGSFDERLQRAKDLFNSAKMEDACEAFKALDREKPGDKQVGPFMKMACDQVKQLQKREEDLFNQGVQLMNQGQLDDARQKFEQSGKIQGLKNFRFREQALQSIRQIDNRLKEAAQKETAQREAAQRAQQEAAQREAALKAQREAAQKESAKKETAKKEAPKTTHEKEIAKASPPEPSTPPPTKSTASNDILRDGLKAYYGGDLEAAERNLTDYIQHQGQKQDLAYFFRGAAHSTRYFLSGEKDAGEKEKALADFKSAKGQEPGFQPPPRKYVSQKILDLYSQAATP